MTYIFITKTSPQIVRKRFILSLINMNILARMRIIPRYVMAFQPQTARAFTTSPCLREPESLVKLRKLQADFQCDDGKPVWLKGGISDRILYTTTLLGCGVSIVLVLIVLYDQAKPNSWKVQ